MDDEEHADDGSGIAKPTWVVSTNVARQCYMFLVSSAYCFGVAPFIMAILYHLMSLLIILILCPRNTLK